MGLDRTVKFAGSVPTYPALRNLLAERGYAVQVRMIDGQLAFPDELPGDDWRELRLGTAAGMVTLRREANQIACVTWGNADAAALQAWNAIAWACAAAGDGTIVAEQGPQSAADFARHADLPPGIKEQP